MSAAFLHVPFNVYILMLHGVHTLNICLPVQHRQQSRLHAHRVNYLPPYSVRVLSELAGSGRFPICIVDELAIITLPTAIMKVGIFFVLIHRCFIVFQILASISDLLLNVLVVP